MNDITLPPLHHVKQVVISPPNIPLDQSYCTIGLEYYQLIWAVAKIPLAQVTAQS